MQFKIGATVSRGVYDASGDRYCAHFRDRRDWCFVRAHACLRCRSRCRSDCRTIADALVRHLPVFHGLPEDQTQVERIHGTICIIAYLLDSVAPGNSWRDDVDTLITSSFAKIKHRRPPEMGVPSAPS